KGVFLAVQNIHDPQLNEIENLGRNLEKARKEYHELVEGDKQNLAEDIRSVDAWVDAAEAAILKLENPRLTDIERKRVLFDAKLCLQRIQDKIQQTSSDIDIV